MKARDLAEKLMENPDKEVCIIDYNAKPGEDIFPVKDVYNDDEKRTVLSWD